ncbi:MAG: YkgJ family cysteine cluster protein [Nanoarchaeota archaeon]|nr:YkgJ family cysteine cluster protein [Nanoarchaeota archaeon]
MRSAEEIAADARDSISKFCVEECKAYCCRKGYLVLTPSEAALVCGGKLKEFESRKIIKKLPFGQYSLFLGNPDGCPCLKENCCTIHKNPKRPDTCKTFPLFIEGNKIKLSQRCLAVKQDMMYPYIAELLKKGYKLIKINEETQ